MNPRLLSLLIFAFFLGGSWGCVCPGCDDEELAEATEEAVAATERAYQTQAAKFGPTLRVIEGTEKAAATKNAGTQTAQAASGLKALLVVNGPADVPGWDGAYELELADETHLVYYLPEDWMYEKAPYVYLELMPQYGWELSGDGMVTEGNTTTMIFVKDDRTATIVISIESDRRVKVAIEITAQ